MSNTRCKNYPKCKQRIIFKHGYCKECYNIFLQERILELLIMNQSEEPVIKEAVKEIVSPQPPKSSDTSKPFIPSIDVPVSGRINVSQDVSRSSIGDISDKLKMLSEEEG